MKSLFEPEIHQDILNRIEKLNENTQAQWGKMNITQMLKHCQLPLEIALGKRKMKTKAGFLKKLLFKAFKPMLYNNKLWKRNSPTAKELIVTDNYNFTTEKENLVSIINEFANLKDNKNWPKHPIFGYFTTKQRGKMHYKHLNHHLTQFGV